MKKLIFHLLIFSVSIGRTYQNHSVRRPGKTPGVKTPGDISYFTPTCLTSPEGFSHSNALLGREVVSLRLLLASKTRNKKVNRKRGGSSRPEAWLKPHLNENDLKLIDFLIKHFSDEKRFCPFQIKNCVVSNYTYHRYDRKKGKVLEMTFSDAQVAEMLSVDKGSWGTCALVGLADTLLQTKRGKEIDAHDTVIRLGELPLKKFSEFVGKKTDVTWVRRSAKMAPRGTISKERNMVRMYIGHNNGNKQMPTLVPFQYMSQQSPRKGYLGFAGDIYEIFRVDNWNIGGTGKQKQRSPSSGFTSALHLIFSGFCTRIDLYGFSFDCGGAYHDRGHIMQLLHNCELESWIFHHFMKAYPELGVCVYL